MDADVFPAKIEGFLRYNFFKGLKPVHNPIRKSLHAVNMSEEEMDPKRYTCIGNELGFNCIKIYRDASLDICMIADCLDDGKCTMLTLALPVEGYGWHRVTYRNGKLMHVLPFDNKTIRSS